VICCGKIGREAERLCSVPRSDYGIRVVERYPDKGSPRAGGAGGPNTATLPSLGLG
jgi:hypothetical protein